MSIRKVSSALVKSYVDLGLNLPTRYEGRDFKPPAADDYAEIFVLPSDNRVHSLSDKGLNIYTGIFQINFHTPEAGDNQGKMLDWGDLCLEMFRPAVWFVYSGQGVQVIKCVPSRIHKSTATAGYVMSVSVYFRAWMARDGSLVSAPGGPPPVGGGGQQDYEFNQVSPLAVWVINHNLGRKVSTEVYNLGGMEVGAEVQNINDNQTIVTFDVPTAGYAIIN